jgi:hypothetical protein
LVGCEPGRQLEYGVRPEVVHFSEEAAIDVLVRLAEVALATSAVGHDRIGVSIPRGRRQALSHGGHRPAQKSLIHVTHLP